MNTEQEIKKQIEVLKEQQEFLEGLLEQPKEVAKEKFWKPKYEESYLYFDRAYTVGDLIFDNECSSRRTENANYYKLSEKKLAEKDAAKMRASQIIQRTADQLHGKRYDFKIYNDNYYVSYVGDRGLDVDYKTDNLEQSVYFESRILALRCLDLCHKEYEILFDVGVS